MGRFKALSLQKYCATFHVKILLIIETIVEHSLTDTDPKSLQCKYIWQETLKWDINPAAEY